MASNIDQTKPVEGNPTTASVRANFLTAKTEIENLQNSSSSTGIHITEDDTVGLGAAQGGTQDGRVAYDTDKGILVRDTESIPPGTPYWKETAQRKPLIGTTSARPAFGEITDGNYVNLYYNTDTSTLQLDTGSAWVDIGPGTGGGPTLTEVVIPSFLSTDPPAYVTHPSIPLTGAGSGAIRFTVLGGEIQSRTTEYPTLNMVENLKSSALNWVAETGTKGHFDGAADLRAGEFNLIDIAGTEYAITAYSSPGTGSESVTLSAAAPNGSINYIRNSITYGGAVRNSYYYDGATTHYAHPTVLSYVTESASNMLTPTDAAKMVYFEAIFGYHTGTAAKGLLTLDGGSTWISFDGSAWVTVTLADLDSQGMVIPLDTAGYIWLDSVGSAVPLDDLSATPVEGWGTLRTALQAAGPALDFRMAVGVRGTELDATHGFFQHLGMNWRAEDVVTSLAIGQGYSSSIKFRVARLTETVTEFTKISSSTYDDVHCQVWI
jgi:hypothetical protein